MPNDARKGKSADTEEGLAEKEQDYQAVSQTLRRAQTERSRYIEEMHQVISKLKAYIEELEKEKDTLVTGLQIADSRGNQLRDEKTCEDLANLGDNKDWLTDQTDDERALQNDLDVKIRDVERRLKTLQKSTGGSNISGTMAMKNSRKVKILHSRLSHALTKYNEILGLNTILRNDIDTLRMERARYDLMYKKLDILLTKLRTEITNTVESATIFYDQRVEAHTKMLQITERCDKDLAQHNLEMKELVRIIDHDRKLRTFMTSKSLERKEDPQLTAWKTRQAKDIEEKAIEVANTVNLFERAFDEMLVYSGHDNIERLVECFVEKEDRNYALFNYVAELNSNVDGLIEEVGKIKRDINYLDSDSFKIEISYRDNINVHEIKKKELLRLIEANQNMLQIINECINSIVDTVRVIFEKTGCDNTNVDKKLGPKGPQTHNILTFIPVIENRINELLLLRNFINQQDSDVIYEPKTVLIGNLLTSPIGSPSVKVPVIPDDYEDALDGSDELRPCTRAELHHKVMNAVRMREKEGTENNIPDINITNVAGKKR